MDAGLHNALHVGATIAGATLRLPEKQLLVAPAPLFTNTVQVSVPAWVWLNCISWEPEDGIARLEAVIGPLHDALALAAFVELQNAVLEPGAEMSVGNQYTLHAGGLFTVRVALFAPQVPPIAEQVQVSAPAALNVYGTEPLPATPGAG